MNDRKAHSPVGLPLTIISGGQTGVDRAALDVAIALDIPHGGWCPLGRVAEDGPIPNHYSLREMPTNNYVDRTRQNVIDSDGTLILYETTLKGGTLMTRAFAEQIGKPCLAIRLSRPGTRKRVHDWLQEYKIRSLNIAGPRASKEPLVYDRSVAYLTKLLTTDRMQQNKLLF